MQADAVVFADFLQSGTLLDDRSLLDAFVYQALVSEECVLVTLNYDDRKLEPARVSLSRVLTDCVWLPSGHNGRTYLTCKNGRLLIRISRAV